MNTRVTNDSRQCHKTQRRWKAEKFKYQEETKEEIFLKSIQGKNYSYRRCGKKIQPMCKRRSQRRPKHWKTTNTITCKIKNILELEKQKF